ncbi:polysaccharide lyase family 14 protein [Phlebopus sp. FC_14]|nr:polysaccharide lyase family 14 protein [Phlebopus sp. FC_14]
MTLIFLLLALVAGCIRAAPAGSDILQTDSQPASIVTTSSFSPSPLVPVSTLSLLTSPTPITQLPNPTPTTIPASSTLIVTQIVTDFETVDIAPTPTTLTSVVTVVVSTTVIVTPTPTPAQADATMWTPPPQMTDISAFNVTYFPSGQQNLAIVDAVPAASANASRSQLSQTSVLDAQNTSNQSTVLQLVYPAHSVNPGSKPAGGADFYASPLNLIGARNVTLEYSVFFPADFEWVKGGKLPGLYGGHTGCSGGASARDCFSTRLMWRENGAGELYLYAPKDKQTDALCSDPQSVCDAAYGLSIGRGAFNFTAGVWTSLRQNVVLNTPGKQDGVFTLFVNGGLVISRADVFYRDVPQQESMKFVAGSRRASPNSPPSPTSSGISGPLLDVSGNEMGQAFGRRDSGQPAEFLGLFFSTFFGGHGQQYATPKEQYTWFKDFAITRHF